MSTYLTLKLPYSNELANEFFEFLELPLMSHEDIAALPDTVIMRLINEHLKIQFKTLSKVYAQLLDDNRNELARHVFKVIINRSKDMSFGNSYVETGFVRNAFECALKNEEFVSVIDFLDGRVKCKIILAYLVKYSTIPFLNLLLRNVKLTNVQITSLINCCVEMPYKDLYSIIKYLIDVREYKVSPTITLINMFIQMHDSKNKVDEIFLKNCLKKNSLNNKVVRKTVLFCANHLSKSIPKNTKNNILKLLGYIIDNDLWKIDAVVTDSNSLIWIGLRKKSVLLFNFAIEKGANLTKLHNQTDYSLADFAIANGHVEMLQILSTHGAYSNKEALQRAMCNNDLKEVERLLQLGVDPSKGTLNGLRLVEFARKELNYELTELLQKYGG